MYGLIDTGTDITIMREIMFRKVKIPSERENLQEDPLDSLYSDSSEGESQAGSCQR